MPQIKNLAVVVFETAEQAEAARQATSGRSWPDNGVRNSLRPRCSSRHQSLGFRSCMCPSILASHVRRTLSYEDSFRCCAGVLYIWGWIKPMPVCRAG